MKCLRITRMISINPERNESVLIHLGLVETVWTKVVIHTFLYHQWFQFQYQYPSKHFTDSM